MLLALAGLMAQYGAVGLLGGRGEPWPALVMPAFQQTWAGDEELRFDRVRLSVILEDGSAHDVELGDLLVALPPTHHPHVARAHFACSEAELSPSLAAWLRRRLGALIPEARPERIHIVWEEVSVPRAEGAARARLTPVRTCAHLL